MNADKFPWLSLGLGLTLMLVLMASGALQSVGQQRLPLLTLLIINEFGFFVTLFGAVQAVRQLMRDGVGLKRITLALGCGGLAAAFLWLGLALWQGMQQLGQA